MAIPYRRIALTLAGASALSLACTGCISYTIGQGAETVPVNERATSSSMNYVPGTLGDGDQETSTRRISVDSDVRFGVDDRTDIGVRINTYTGVMLTWKRQLGRPDTSSRPENRARSALMLGSGIVNMGEHGAVEGTLITSGPWTTVGQWYGGARITQVIPLSRTARHDDPVVGISIGHLFGDRESSIGPELGLYYDRSTLGLNSNRILVIPSIVIRKGGLPFLGRR
jgi:hypothetical protein